jgi:nicotinate-nucleotide--dimethylbenzimidazole phosphoribosyltransferase
MSSLDLDALAERVTEPDEASRERARARQRELVKPAGSLGRLEELAAWLAGVQAACPTRPIVAPRAVVFAGDHGIAQAGVSAYPTTATARLVRGTLDGGTAVSVLARLAGAGLRVLDLAVDDELAGLPADVGAHKVRRGSGRIDTTNALSRDEAERAVRAGIAIADAEVDSGADLLIVGGLGVGGSTPAAVLVGVLTGADAASVTGRGTGIDDAAWMRKCAAIRDTLRRARPVLADPVELLATCGGADFAALTGFLLQAAVRRTPVILDDLTSCACALLAQRIAFRATDWWQAGPSTTDPAHRKALDRLALEPLLDYTVSVGAGAGALLALPLVTAAAATLAEMSTFAEAGIEPPGGGQRLAGPAAFAGPDVT